MSNHLFSGNWRTSFNNRQSTITTKPLEKFRFFRIACTKIIDTESLKFQFIVDGKSFVTTMKEGNSLILQGKSVHFLQLETTIGECFGDWEIIDDQETEYFETLWSAHPDAETHNILAFFEDELDFVLSFKMNPKCLDGILHIIIDGREIKDIKGRTLSLLTGNCITGKGKTVATLITGNCAPGHSFSGSLKIRKK